MGDDGRRVQIVAGGGYRWTAQYLANDVYRVEGQLLFLKPKLGSYTQRYLFLALGADDPSQPGGRGEMMTKALQKLDHYFTTVVQHHLAADDSTWQSKTCAHTPGTRRPIIGTSLRCSHRKRKSGGVNRRNLFEGAAEAAPGCSMEVRIFHEDGTTVGGPDGSWMMSVHVKGQHANHRTKRRGLSLEEKGRAEELYHGLTNSPPKAVAMDLSTPCCRWQTGSCN